MDSVQSACSEFAQRLHDKQRANLAATLRSADLQVSKEAVRLEVINEVRLGQWDDIRPDLLDHLRRTLRNAAIELRVEVTERDEPVVKFMTDRDRYDAMAAAQPGLDVLRRRLDLDLR